MTLSESEIRGFILRKVIKERSIGGEDKAAFRQRRRKCERESFGEEDGGALTQEDSPKLQKREIGDFGGGTPYSSSNNTVQPYNSKSYSSKLPWEPCHLTGFSQ